MDGEIFYIIGQALGIVAVAFGFVSFQMRSPGKILLLQIITAFVFSAHYLLIGAMTAMALNLIAAVKCVSYYVRDSRGGKGLFLPIFFTLLVAVTSIMTWEGWYSVMIMLGLMVNSIGLALSDAKKIKIAVYIKSPLCLAYNLIVMSGGGIIYECAVLISTTVSLVRERLRGRSEAAASDGEQKGN